MKIVVCCICQNVNDITLSNLCVKCGVRLTYGSKQKAPKRLHRDVACSALARIRKDKS